MATLKYKKDEKGRTILGEQFGITVTRPWSQEMYNHNDDVAATMKNNIFEALTEIYDTFEINTEGTLTGDEDSLRELSKFICYYGFGDGYDTTDIYERTCEELERMQNYQLHEQYSNMVKAGFVRPEEIGFVGYDKL